MLTKQELRAAVKAKRDAIPADEKKQADAAILARILASEEYRNASAILLYAPYGSEINLLPLVRAAREAGKPVAFPRCDTAQNTMQFYVLEPHARLQPGAYNIPEPPADAPLCPLDERTLCILPGLTFDASGGRLGYGKGYYDRFLATFKGVTVGALYERLLVKEVPTDAHDIPVQLLFTENRRHVTNAAALPAVKPRQTEEAAAAKGERSFAATVFSRLRGVPWGPILPPLLVACTFVLLLLSRLVDAYLITRENEYLIVILLQPIIFLVPAVVYGKLRGDAFSSRIRISPIRRRHIWFLLCTAVVMITGALLLCILTGGIEGLTGNFTLYDTFVARINSASPMETVYVILAYCLLPAFCEEVVFRSILCAEYEKFGVSVAIAASALFFAMLHGSLPLFPAYLFLGAVLAGAMYATRSFFAAFLLHLSYNLFCLFGQPYLSFFYVTTGNNEIFLFCLGTLFLLFSAFAVGEARKIYHRYALENADASYTVPLAAKAFPRALGKALLSPAAFLCVILFLTVAIVSLTA